MYLFNIFNNNNNNVIKRVLGVKNMKNSAKQGKKTQVANYKTEIIVMFSKMVFSH